MPTKKDPGTFKIRNIEKLLSARRGEIYEKYRATLAGQDMGLEDKVQGIFDDAPPMGITGDNATIYRDAYQKVNPRDTGVDPSI